MNQLMINSVMRLVMGGISWYLLSRGFDQSLIDNINGVLSSLIGGGAVAGLALAWSAKDKKASAADPIFIPDERLENVSRETVEPVEPEIIGKGYTFSERSLAAMVGLHPKLVELLETAIVNAPIDFTVIEGVRSKARQAELLASGASLTMNSKHLKQADGFSHAFDLGYIHDGILDGKYQYYAALNDHIQKIAQRLEIPVRWGGTFKRSNGKPFVDAGHWQLETV